MGRQTCFKRICSDLLWFWHMYSIYLINTKLWFLTQVYFLLPKFLVSYRCLCCLCWSFGSGTKCRLKHGHFVNKRASDTKWKTHSSIQRRCIVRAPMQTGRLTWRRVADSGENRRTAGLVYCRRGAHCSSWFPSLTHVSLWKTQRSCALAACHPEQWADLQKPTLLPPLASVSRQ